jgi:hypothetical protein
MKKILLLLSLFGLTNCNTMQQLNSNMEASNELMIENKAAIEENTRQIMKSTAAMKGFEILFPIFFFVILLALAYICIKLKLFHKIFKNLK